MFVVWLTRAGHLKSTELLRYKVLQLYNALRLCGAVRQIVRKENYMNNFRKRIGHLLCLCFTLAILVTCFMASGITASADRYAPNCSVHYRTKMRLRSCNVGAADPTTLMEWYHNHRYMCPEGMCRESASKRILMITNINCLAGGSSGGGSYVPSHTHNYSTTWGAWRKISSCRFPG